MDSLSRQYYERSLGAGMFVSPETENGIVGYSEPLRRFIQHEGFTPQVNEIENKMPSWIPGEDHLINFRKGDPYIEGRRGLCSPPRRRLSALHPELEGVDPEDYPDITKLSILGDVAPYSREYNRIRATVEKQTHGDAELRSRYEQIVEQVRQTKQSTLQVDQRRFDAPVDQIQGTVKSASFKGVELNEYPAIRLGPLLPENINHLARARDPPAPDSTQQHPNSYSLGSSLQRRPSMSSAPTTPRGCPAPGLAPGPNPLPAGSPSATQLPSVLDPKGIPPKYLNDRILWDFLSLPGKHHSPRPAPAQIPKYRILWDFLSLPGKHDLDQSSAQAGGASQTCGKVLSNTPIWTARIST